MIFTEAAWQGKCVDDAPQLKARPSHDAQKLYGQLSYQTTMPRPAYCMASASSLQKPRGSLKASTRPTRFKHCISTLLIEKKIPHLSKDKLKKGVLCDGRLQKSTFSSRQFEGGSTVPKNSHQIGVGHRNESHKHPRSSLADKASKS